VRQKFQLTVFPCIFFPFHIHPHFVHPPCFYSHLILISVAILDYMSSFTCFTGLKDLSLFVPKFSFIVSVLLQFPCLRLKNLSFLFTQFCFHFECQGGIHLLFWQEFTVLSMKTLKDTFSGFLLGLLSFHSGTVYLVVPIYC
jgi:hypothetical protein